MIGISESIILGVFSGILTAFILWVLSKIFIKLVLPWYQNLIYRGLKISGEWIGFYEDKIAATDDSDPHYSIFIEQKGSVVEGTLARNKNQNESRDYKEFLFTGLFREGNLVISYRPKDETRLGLGTYVMRLADDGRKLNGISTYIPSNSNGASVAQFKVVWKRKI